MNFLTRKLFISNAWTIGFRAIGADDEPVPGVDVSKASYQILPINDENYYADPFIFECEQGTFLFAEHMDRVRGIGSIAVSEFFDGKFSRFQDVLLESFHLSYPNVFAFGNEIFMIPESSAVKEVRLYRASRFPDKWELDSVLLSGKSYVDTSVLVCGDTITLFTYDFEAKESKQFDYDRNRGTVTENTAVRLVDERPAGNPITTGNGELIRPLQDCGGYYGKGILWTKIRQGCEEKIGELYPGTYELSARIPRITGTHTFNRSARFEVIDIRYDRFCLTKQWIKIKGKIRNRRWKH